MDYSVQVLELSLAGILLLHTGEHSGSQIGRIGPANIEKVSETFKAGTGFVCFTIWEPEKYFLWKVP